MARVKVASSIPEAGQQAPPFHLPSAQGGQLHLSTRTVRGPVVVAFYRPWAEEDVGYFSELAKKEEEINLAAATVVGIGIAEPDAAREFVAESGINSYVLYDYSQVATREWGLLEKDKDHGEHSRPAVFIIGPDDDKVLHAWVDERPSVEEIYAKIHEITGLPIPPEEQEEEKPKKKSAKRKSSGGEEGEQKESAGEGSSEKAGEQSPAAESRQEQSGGKAEEEQNSGADASGESSGSGNQEAPEGSSGGEGRRE